MLFLILVVNQFIITLNLYHRIIEFYIPFKDLYTKFVKKEEFIIATFLA